MNGLGSDQQDREEGLLWLLFLTNRLIQADWVQDDLPEGQIDYAEKLNAIVSFSSILPIFA